MIASRFIAIAFAIILGSVAHAADRPTDQEILKAAQAQGLSGIKTAGGMPSENSAWTISAVLIDENGKAESDDTLRVYGQLRAETDLYIESRKYGQATLVTPTFASGSGISLAGKMRFQRVGLFTRTWEIKFAWSDAMPPGLPLKSYASPISTASDEGKAIALKISSELRSEMERQQLESQAKMAAVNADREAAEARMAAASKSDEEAIAKALSGFEQKWLPYTIVTPTDDPQTMKSDFRAVHIDQVAKDTVQLTLLLGGNEAAPRATLTASLQNGRLTFVDTDKCQIEVVPSRRDNGTIFMLFGSRQCTVSRQHLSIVLEERTPKQVAEFIARINSGTREPSRPTQGNFPLPALRP